MVVHREIIISRIQASDCSLYAASVGVPCFRIMTYMYSLLDWLLRQLLKVKRLKVTTFYIPLYTSAKRISSRLQLFDVVDWPAL